MAESVNSLMEAICENLTRTMAEDKAVRENAEQQLAMLETNEGKTSFFHLSQSNMSWKIMNTLRFRCF